MFIGAHVSIAGGFDKCIDNAVKIGANCLQTFASSPRSLKMSDYSSETISQYLFKKKQASMGPHFFHGVYLINLATEKAGYLQISIDSLVSYQQFAGQIGGMGTIFHIGSHKGSGFAEVREQVLQAIESVLSKTPDGVRLFLENAAGHAGVIGSDFLELGWLVEHVSSGELKEKLSICLDTQHAFASGYDLRTAEGLNRLVNEAEAAFGWGRVGAIHANDSMVEFSSHRDRHQNIGEGLIGLDGFRLIVNHPQFKNLPFILEVPGEAKSGPRPKDVQSLIDLIA